MGMFIHAARCLICGFVANGCNFQGLEALTGRPFFFYKGLWVGLGRFGLKVVGMGDVCFGLVDEGVHG